MMVRLSVSQLEGAARGFLRAGASRLAGRRGDEPRIAVRSDETQRDRDHLRRLRGLVRRRRAGLRKLKRERSRRRVVAPARSDKRRARLRVPAHELGQVAAGALREAADEILNGRSGSIAPLEVQVHALAEGFSADQPS
jgi:hypothetical protein